MLGWRIFFNISQYGRVQNVVEKNQKYKKNDTLFCDINMLYFAQKIDENNLCVN
jgi:hypothetical protein